ncbi:MAG: metal ABC transporter ATP-binding protein [Prolixibacteraceae bacterium]|jgi:zinc transport system ATP-binding protein|nr:metal ABC transporter ATP-binding protein [Prolixibacteraceae bacterium]
MNELIEIRDLTVRYGEYTAIKDVNLTISQSDFIGVIGPNGGGKTTLLKALLGLLKPSSGKITFSKKLKNKQSDIGYLPQINKFDHRFPITVKEVILSGMAGKNRWMNPYGKNDNEKLEKIINELHIEHIVKKPIGELSGGQMQRVFLGRALISEPKLLVLDEPDTYVDNQFEHELYEMLVELNKRMAILLVSHDVGTISSYVKGIACINTVFNYHPSNIISPEQLKAYNCPIQIITHGEVPHTVLGKHNHQHSHNDI